MCILISALCEMLFMHLTCGLSIKLVNVELYFHLLCCTEICLCDEILCVVNFKTFCIVCNVYLCKEIAK